MGKGSRPAFDSLFRKYYAPLCRFACFFTGNGDDAEEAVQTAFITFWESKGKIAITRSVKAYLYQMVRNNALMHLRKTETRKRYESDFVEKSEQEMPEEKSYTDGDINRMVARGMEILPDRCRTIFALSRFDGLSYEEIATYLDISPKTVENQMGLAFQKLREYLLPAWKKMLLVLGVLILRII